MLKGLDIYDAKEVSKKIDIPHYVLDYEESLMTWL